MNKVIIYTDGGARGNPGPAAIGLMICSPDHKVLAEHQETIGQTTNNVAEYRALIEALTRARSFQPQEVVCYSDSQLMIEQLKGNYKVKQPHLQELFQKVQTLLQAFKQSQFHHVRRENEWIQRVDALLNNALDQAERGQL